MRNLLGLMALGIVAVAVSGFFAPIGAQTTYTLSSIEEVTEWRPAGGPLTYDATTNVATLTGNISGSLVIGVSGAVIDGRGFSLTGTGSGNGILINAPISRVTVKNFGAISGFASGIRIATLAGTTFSTESNVVTGNTIYGCGFGIDIQMGNTRANRYHTIKGNTIGSYIEGGSNNRGVSIVGYVSGLTTARSIGDSVYDNTIQNNTTGLFFSYVASSDVYHNNFVGNTTQASVTGSLSTTPNSFNKPLPAGGNFWSDWTSPDVLPPAGFVDNPYPGSDLPDNYPFTTKDGWKVSTDVTPPATTESHTGTSGTNNWFISFVNVTLTATDNSGVASTQYSLQDSISWQPYTGPIVVGTEGHIDLYYRSTDTKGNVEPAKLLELQIDLTAPVTTATLSGTVGNNGWYTSDVSVSLNAVDATSGIASTNYSFDGNTWYPYAPLVITESTTLFYHSTDNAGIIEATKSAEIKINIPPVLGAMSAPAAPMAIGTEVSVSATFTDPDANDAHTATWNWGDGTSSDGVVTNFTATGTHTYGVAGVYTIEVAVTDACGARATASFSYVVVYNPNGGFITGGGWIQSPEGAYVSNPTLKGKAEFGFNAKYGESAVPKGNLEFQLKPALKLKATSYEWLVVSGAVAQAKGVGTSNGSGNYGFLVSAVDGKINGDGIDRIRLKVWDKNNGDAPVYDSEIGVDELAVPTLALGGGSITVHKSGGETASSLASLDEAVAEDVQGTLAAIPTEYALYNAYPNPFNPTTTIQYDLPEDAFVSLKVFDLLGREVSDLVNRVQSAGTHRVQFNAESLKSGVYIYRIQASKFTQTKKLVLVK